MAVWQRQQTQGADLRQWVRHRTEKGDTHVCMYININIYIYIVHTYIYIIKHSICIFFDDYVYDISILYAFEFVWTKSFDPDTCHDVIIRILINLWLDTVVCLLVRSWV